MTNNTTRRERLHDATREEIKSTARQHMATQGTAAISIRAIARDMGLTAPAIYRYFGSLDDLITGLILDAFNALADALEIANGSQSQDDYAARMLTVLMAYRQWALAHPVDFQLIYGNPIPGYEAPREVTVPAVVRGFKVVVGILAAAHYAGKLHPAEDYATLPPNVQRHLVETIERDGYPIPPVALYLGVVGWTRVHGMIMLELFNHIQPVIGDMEQSYQFEVAIMVKQWGFR